MKVGGEEGLGGVGHDGSGDNIRIDLWSTKSWESTHQGPSETMSRFRQVLLMCFAEVILKGVLEVVGQLGRNTGCGVAIGEEVLGGAG